jgi:hypothetical protein
MRAIFALLAGAGAAAVAILFHQSLPPYGVIAGLLISYLAIWMIGRTYGSRKLKFLAFLSWLALIFRAGTFGVGQELLVQGDGVGSTLFLIGTPIVFAAVVARN